MNSRGGVLTKDARLLYCDKGEDNRKTNGRYIALKKVIIKTLYDRLADKKVDKKNAEIQGAIFSSGLIGLFTYILFEKPNVSNELLGRYMTKLLAFSLRL